MSEAVAIRVRSRALPPSVVEAAMDPQPTDTQPSEDQPRVRVRARPAEGDPALPSPWPNGSAVFAAGYKRKVPAWVTSDEQVGGLLGRIVQVAKGQHNVWRWSAAKGSYVFLGKAGDHLAALGMLT